MTELESVDKGTGTSEALAPGRGGPVLPSAMSTRLGPAISAEVEAIRNDMEQARELAAEYQKALAGKSNEFAELKQTLERTQRELAIYQVQQRSGAVAPAAKAGTKPVASAEIEALMNDMEAARELAADYQRALAGKSNEYAELKQVFEKTQRDLTQLQVHVTELREERHRLANDAMRTAALELRVQRITKERDDLQAEVEALRKNGPAPAVLDLTPVEAETEQAPLEVIANVDLIVRAPETADRDFIHIAYKKGEMPEEVEAEMSEPRPPKARRTVRTF